MAVLLKYNLEQERHPLLSGIINQLILKVKKKKLLNAISQLEAKGVLEM